ncbi:C-X-C chemokine receptor type 3-like isoform X1 [Centroberyx gerrardi]
MTNMDLYLGGIFVQNSTYDYGDYVYEGDCKPESRGYLEAVLYSLALVVGLLGNGLLLVVLAQRRRTWSVTDTFILHLGVADCLLLITLPFWAAEGTQDQGWSFGTPFCKTAGAIFNINFYCGIFLLAFISLDRYLSIVHAVQLYSRRKPWLVHISCLSVWLFSLLLIIPDYIFLEAVKHARQGQTVCTHNYPRASQSVFDWRLASRLLYHIVGFLLPSAVLLFCYSCILLRLQRGSQGLQKQRAVRVILALVVVFFLCWTPYNITLMVDTFQSNYKAPEESTDGVCGKTSLETGLMVTSALGCFHACLNPLLYLGLCRNFRKRVLEMLRCVRGAQADSRCSLWELGVGEEALPNQAHEKVVLNQMTNPEHQVQSSQS